MKRGRRALASLPMLAVLAVLACATQVAGCGDDVRVGPAQPAGTGASGATAATDGGAGTAQAVADAGGSRSERIFSDDDFVEAETNRDPFRSYARMFRVKSLETPQYAVILSTTGIEEMRLIAIVSGIDQPLGMLVDTANVGHVVKRGDYIGRTDVVQVQGSEVPITLNWRVDRVREHEVVLTREDPRGADLPPLTRVIPLNSEGPAALNR